MEEKIKDVYENIKDRLSNPLIFSFLCSWLVLNWKIPVALIWYDKSQFSGCGCQTIFDFIEWHWKKEGTFWWPVLIAFTYTLLIPFVKNGIRIIFVRAQKWGDKNEAKYVLGGMTKEHIKLQSDYDEVAKSLIDKNDCIDKLYNQSILRGHWTRIRDGKDKKVIDKIRISDGNIYITENFNNETKESLITAFFYDRNIKKIFFVSEDFDRRQAFDGKHMPQMSYNINILLIKDNGDMSGKENDFDIDYVKHKID